MSNATIQQAVKRVRATREPLAIFKVPGKLDTVNIVFANTVMTQKWIKDRASDFIGIFDRKMQSDEIHKKIQSSING